jgi:hypothetical protein
MAQAWVNGVSFPLPLTAKRGAALISGTNLPLLLRAWTYRHEPLEELVRLALAGGGQAGLVREDFSLNSQTV